MRFAIFVLCLLTAGSAAAQDIADKARLQAAMQRYIERHTVNGAILNFDISTGDVALLYPTQAHSMVLALGDHYVLCTDLRDKAGHAVPLDVYLAQNGRSYVVFHAEIDNRAPLGRLISKGIAKPIRY